MTGCRACVDPEPSLVVKEDVSLETTPFAGAEYISIASMYVQCVVQHYVDTNVVFNNMFGVFLRARTSIFS